MDKLYQYCLANHEWIKEKVVRNESCQIFTLNGKDKCQLISPFLPDEIQC